MTHEGIIISSKNEDFKIYFIKEDETPIIANGYMFISPIVICKIIFDAALKTLVNENKKIYDKYGKQDEKMRNEIEIYEEENKKIIEECINNTTGNLNDSAKI